MEESLVTLVCKYALTSSWFLMFGFCAIYSKSNKFYMACAMLMQSLFVVEKKVGDGGMHNYTCCKE
jgi:hypothetical protein